MLRVILNTDVFLSGLSSRNGSSFQILKMIKNELFKLVVSVPLVFEYHHSAKRASRLLGLTHEQIDDVLDYFCLVAYRQSITHHWRTYFQDPKSEMILSLALASDADYIITHKTEPIVDMKRFGIRIVTPQLFLKKIGAPD